MLLEKIEKENDIKKIDPHQLPLLAEEVRGFLLEKVSQTGGHLASNLGVVELTIALHRFLDLPNDKIVWDVGHQSYTHKILTGRKKGFDTLRSFGQMSGFPKREESACDAFNTGHSSTSLSAGLGLVCARDLKHEKCRVVSVIGDGSMTGGMAYEALNNAAQLKTNFIIILNDNEMSISENVGGLSRYLGGIRTATAYQDLKQGVKLKLRKLPGGGEKVAYGIRKTKSSLKQLIVPGMFFEEMGITYLGPVDGHNIPALMRVLKEAERIEGAVIVHVLTKKGKGYLPAERNPSRFHGTGPFEIRTGQPLKKRKALTWTAVFGKTLDTLAKTHPELCAITAAMSEGTGLEPFKSHYPERFFDVGIAEGHGVTFASGLAAGGMRPCFAVYASFLQRGYDQLVHDVAMQNLPVIFGVDRAGLVGRDGETHQGLLDVPFLRTIPHMTVMAPGNAWELKEMLTFAVEEIQGPVAIRYPRGQAFTGLKRDAAPIKYGKVNWIYRENTLCLLTSGHMLEEGEKARKILKAKGLSVSLVNARFLKPIDTEFLLEAAETHTHIVVVEENMKIGGIGEACACFANTHQLPVKVCPIAVDDRFVAHGDVPDLRALVGLTGEKIAERILEITAEEKVIREGKEY